MPALPSVMPCVVVPPSLPQPLPHPTEVCVLPRQPIVNTCQLQMPRLGAATAAAATPLPIPTEVALEMAVPLNQPIIQSHILQVRPVFESIPAPMPTQCCTDIQTRCTSVMATSPSSHPVLAEGISMVTNTDGPIRGTKSNTLTTQQRRVHLVQHPQQLDSVAVVVPGRVPALQLTPDKTQGASAYTIPQSTNLGHRVQGHLGGQRLHALAPTSSPAWNSNPPPPKRHANFKSAGSTKKKKKGKRSDSSPAKQLPYQQPMNMLVNEQQPFIAALRDVRESGTQPVMLIHDETGLLDNWKGSNTERGSGQLTDVSLQTDVHQVQMLPPPCLPTTRETLVSNATQNWHLSMGGVPNTTTSAVRPTARASDDNQLHYHHQHQFHHLTQDPSNHSSSEGEARSTNIHRRQADFVGVTESPPPLVRAQQRKRRAEY